MRLQLYFDLYTRFIIFVLGDTYKILRGTSLLFSSNSFQSFIPGGKSIPLIFNPLFTEGWGVGWGGGPLDLKQFLF